MNKSLVLELGLLGNVIVSFVVFIFPFLSAWLLLRHLLSFFILYFRMLGRNLFL